MAMFNSYVKLPEGMFFLVEKMVNAWVFDGKRALHIEDFHWHHWQIRLQEGKDK